MSKKTLPKAIRPSDQLHGALSEPMPEKAESGKVRRASSEKADNVSAFGPDERKTNARRLVERFAFWAGIAGLLPVPVVDLAAVGGLQIQMLRRLSQIYDVPFSANRGKAIIASFVGTMIPASTGLGMRPARLKEADTANPNLPHIKGRYASFRDHGRDSRRTVLPAPEDPYRLCLQ